MRITKVKFINELTREIITVKKEGEDWVFPYKVDYKVDRGLWSVYSFSCEEVDDDLNGG